MDPGEASKMSGRLAWACSHTLNKLGRAMLRPLYDQSSRRDGAMDAELRRALVWWKTVLGMRIAVLRSWHGVRAAPVHLFCDACGKRGLGAVLFVDGACLWTRTIASQVQIDFFKRRRDKQIMGLELLSITLGFSSFVYWLRHRDVVIHSDNTGSEVLRIVRVVWVV